MGTAELIAEAERLSSLLDKGLQALRSASVEFAEAEHDYRQARARAWLAARGTVPERESQVELKCGELRRARDLADGVRLAAQEAVRSRRAQLSALQSVLAAVRAEADYVRTSS